MASVIKQSHIINLTPGVSAPVIVHCSQGDVGRTIDLIVYNGDSPFDLTGSSVEVHGVRPDMCNFGPTLCSFSESTVSFALTSAMTAISGGVLAEITVSKSGTFVGSANFALMVENATWVNGVTYSNDVSVYENILAYVQSNLGFLASRVDNIASIPSGSTSGDAELIDIRLEVDGTVATTAGNAVREQIRNLNSDLGIPSLKRTAKNGYPSTDGSHWVGIPGGAAKHLVVPVKRGDTIRVKAKNNKVVGLRGLITYDTSTTPNVSTTAPFNGNIAINNTIERVFAVPENVNYIVICAYYVDTTYALPSYFYLNGYNLSESALTNITNIISGLETERVVRQQADSILNDSIINLSDRFSQDIERVENNLSLEISTRETENSALQTDLEGKLPLPSNGFGTSGMVLRSTGVGTEWVEYGSPTDAQTKAAIDSWLDDHPEATTSIPDHSITIDKLVNGTLKYAIPEMYGAVGDGETDDSAAVQQCVNENKLVYFGGNSYRFKNVQITHDVYILSRATVTPLYCDESRNVFYTLFEINNANAVFNGLNIEGSYTYDTTENPPYSNPLFKAVGGSIRIVGSTISHVRLVNRASTPPAILDRIGAIVTASDSDVYIIDSDISDFDREELIWSLPASLDSPPRRKVVISGCCFHDGYGYSIANAIAKDFVFCNNTVTNWQYSGSAINSFCTNSYVYNNSICGNGFSNIFDCLERTDEGVSFANRIRIYSNTFENNGATANIIHAAANVVDIENNLGNGKTFFRTWETTQPISSYHEEGNSTIIIRGNHFKQSGAYTDIGNRVIDIRYHSDDYVRHLFVCDNELIVDDSVTASACISIPNISKVYLRNNVMYAASLSTSNTNVCCWIHIPSTNLKNIEIISLNNYMKHLVDCNSYLQVLNSSAVTASILSNGDIFDVASDSGYISGDNIERIPAYTNV